MSGDTIVQLFNDPKTLDLLPDADVVWSTKRTKHEKKKIRLQDLVFCFSVGFTH
jgi:hypothetical protein